MKQQQQNDESSSCSPASISTTMTRRIKLSLLLLLLLLTLTQGNGIIGKSVVKIQRRRTLQQQQQQQQTDSPPFGSIRHITPRGGNDNDTTMSYKRKEKTLRNALEVPKTYSPPPPPPPPSFDVSTFNFSISFTSTFSLSFLNGTEFVEEVTFGTEEYLKNVLKNSDFASDGKNAFDKIELTLESIQEVDVITENDNARTRRLRIERKNKQQNLNWKRKKRRRTIFQQNFASNEHLSAKTQRRLRQRHHHTNKVSPNASAAAEVKSNQSVVEITLIFTAVVKLIQPPSKTTNANKIVSYLSQTLQNEEENSKINDYVGFQEIMKRTFQNENEEHEDIMTFWENISNLELTAVGKGGSSLTNTDTMSTNSGGTSSAMVSSNQDCNQKNIIMNAVQNKDENLSFPSSPEIESSSTSIIFTTTTTTTTTPLTNSNEKDEELLDEKNKIITNGNSHQSTNIIHNEHNFGGALPIPTPQKEQQDNGSIKRKQSAAMGLGISAGIIVLILSSTSFFFLLKKRWEERNHNRIEYTNEDVMFGHNIHYPPEAAAAACRPAPSSSSSFINSMEGGGQLQEKESSARSSAFSSVKASNSTMVGYSSEKSKDDSQEKDKMRELEDDDDKSFTTTTSERQQQSLVSHQEQQTQSSLSNPLFPFLPEIMSESPSVISSTSSATTNPPLPSSSWQSLLFPWWEEESSSNTNEQTNATTTVDTATAPSSSPPPPPPLPLFFPEDEHIFSKR